MSQETALTKLDVPGEPTKDGKRLGRYVLRYQVAQGGMATVYLAQMAGPQGFGKWVAIKWIHPHLAQEERFISMFLDEARVTAQVQHPNVCQVIDFVHEEGTSYIVMEYLHGESFSMVSRRAFDTPEGLPVRLALRIVADAARGLHGAHEARGHDGEALGIIHRDVSPQNIQVLYDGGTKMLDFGVARARGRITQTETGEMKGKLAYMAPEQIRRSDIDRRVDVWALGVVLWESIAGRRLFRGDNEGMTLQRVLEGEIPKPSEVRADAGIHEELDRVVLKALSRDPELRYQTAAALADDLEGVLYALKTPTGQSQVSEWMVDRFADKRAVRDKLLRAKFESASGILAVDLESGSVIAPRAVKSPSVSPAATSAAPASGTAVAPTKQPPAWRRLAAFALAAIALVVLGAGLSRLGGTSSEEAELPPVIATTPTADTTPTASTTPAIVPIAGEPEIQVEPEGDIAAVPTGRPTKRAVRPAGPPGMLNLLGLPPADVYYRGQLIGRTPLVNRELPAGRQRLELRWEDTRQQVTVEIRSGETTRQTVRRE